MTFIPSALLRMALGGPVFLYVVSTMAGEEVRNLAIEPLDEGGFQLAWDAPPTAAGKAIYLIEYGPDLESRHPVEDPLVEFTAGRAIWVDDRPLTESLPVSRRSVFYWVSESFPIEESRITRRFGEPGPLPLEVLYADALEPFEADPEALDRYRLRMELSIEQELSHVLGHYIVRFREDVFPYAIERESDPAEQLVTENGVALQTLAAELIESQGGELVAVWESALEGFAAYLPPPLVEELQASELIESVEGDAIGELID